MQPQSSISATIVEPPGAALVAKVRIWKQTLHESYRRTLLNESADLLPPLG